MEIWAVVLAAGHGKRFGGFKQFEEVFGKPLYLLSLRAFLESDELKGIIVVVPEGFVEKVEKETEGLPKRVMVVPGGKTRTESSKMGVTHIPETSTHILIHDAARPNLKPALLRRVIAELKQGENAVVPVVPIRDAVKVVMEGYIVKTLDRRSLFGAQTPQGFKRSVLEKALKNPNTENAFDDAQLLESSRVAIKTVTGDPFNIKITTREDLELLHLLVRLTEGNILDN